MFGADCLAGGGDVNQSMAVRSFLRGSEFFL
jgi:hypothetical protein